MREQILVNRMKQNWWKKYFDNDNNPECAMPIDIINRYKQTNNIDIYNNTL